MTVLNRSIVVLLLVCGFVTGSAVEESCAYSVAVLPVADLTHTRDGVDFAMTERLVRELRQQGLVVTDPDRVVALMVAEKIRRCNSLDSFTARKLAARLGTDTVLQTTVYRREKSADQCNIIMTLYHGKNGQTIWSDSATGHLNDAQPIFGLNGHPDLSTLQNRQLAELARHLVQQQLPPLAVSAAELPAVQIVDIGIDPPLVKGGAPFRCRIKLDFLDETRPAAISIQGGAQSAVLRPAGVPDVYTATLISQTADGEYPLGVTFHWPNGTVTGINAIGSYRVANRPVQLTLNFYNSIKIGDAYAFSEEIKIGPRMKPVRPLDLWRITMRDGRGEVVFSETRYTALPAEMVWRGINRNQRQLDAGYYTLTLMIRDIAGNRAEVSARLYLQAVTDEMVEVKQRVERGRPQLELSTKEAVLIPVERWQLVLENATGVPLLVRKGNQLPATIALPERLTRHDVVCHFVVQDKLGNSYATETVQREAVGQSSEVAQVGKKESSWKADF